MKRALVLGFLLSQFTVVASAQIAAQEAVEFYADAFMLNCELMDDGSATLVQVHMFHVGPEPAISLGFAAPKPSCWTGATWLGDNISLLFLWIGDTQDPEGGLSVSYRGCVPLPIYLGFMNYAVTGGAQSCCSYGPVGIAFEGSIVSASCPPDVVVRRNLGARPIVINPDESCHCLLPLPVEETSWGRVKALYRN